MNPDKLRGVLYGLAAGDRIGGPVRMALQLGRSLAHMGRFKPHQILDRYVSWWKADGFDTGPTAAHVFDLITHGYLPEDAVKTAHQATGQTAGCNPAHRSAPLAIAGFIPNEALEDAVMTEAALTHFDPLAGKIAAAHVQLCRALMRGADWSTALDAYLPEDLQNLLQNQPESYLKRGGYAPDVLFAAVYFVDQHENFEDALRAAIRFAGSANYCPVLAGAIAGGRWGKSAIPDTLLSHCEELFPGLVAITDAMIESWA